MTTRDQAARPGGDTASPAGTVMPKIRGRLRSRLPGPIRTARGQLIVLGGFLLITPIFYGLLALTGGLAKLKLSTADPILSRSVRRLKNTSSKPNSRPLSVRQWPV